MKNLASNSYARLAVLTLILRWCVVLLIARVTFSIVMSYVNYFPPNFNSEFLTGRKSYFFGVYQIAFWVHIIASPIVMVSGTALLNRGLRHWKPQFHRRLGRTHILVVICLVAPSGLWMSLYALTGFWAGLAFACTSLATGLFAALGWRAAVQGRFSLHQEWMTRCYLLLCSAIILRLLSGLATVCQYDAPWTYPLFAWLSLIAPILSYEVVREWTSRLRLNFGR